MMASHKVSHFITSTVLGIDVNERYSHLPQNLNERAKQAIAPADIYLEDEPSVSEWFKELAPTRHGVAQYVQELFPFATWITRYGFNWLLGDVIAGITIGLVVVPQAMAYALLAQLTPAHGLYTSFTGAVLYWVFGTSKDIVIGTTAVGSLLVGQVISHVEDVSPGQYTNEEIAHALSMMSGAVLLFFGLFRLGWIIEFIPYIPISAFITAASITIMSTQVPTALGITGINTRESPYKIIINTLSSLPDAKLDAAIGITTIVLLFVIRDLCTFMEARHPQMKRTWSYVSSLRLTFVMVLFTLVSFLINRGRSFEESKFRIVGKIEPGFQRASVPMPSTDLIGTIMPQLPAVAIILVIEHIAIAKAMGRQFNYTVNPSQEIVALGAANIFSPFMGGYVCTGSFGASAVLSKAGVKTPIAGVFSALVLVLALYVLTAVFYYIPKAALAGLIIHAVYNLIAPPKKLYTYWQLSPLETCIWLVGVIVAIFESLEVSIYVGTGLSAALLLFRLARTRGTFLGRVKAQRAIDEKDHAHPLSRRSSHTTLLDERESRDVFLPLDRKDASNPDVGVESPYPGVFIYRFNEGYNYTNQAYHIDTLVHHITDKTCRMSEEHYDKESDRPWNDPGPKKHKSPVDNLPYLRAVVLDFSSVNNLDITCIQGLVDMRTSLDKYSAPDAVEWHFASVHNRWARRALAAAGFGFPTSRNPEALSSWIPAYSIAPVLTEDRASVSQVSDIEAVAVCIPEPVHEQSSKTEEEEKAANAAGGVSGKAKDVLNSPPSGNHQPMAAIFGVDRPFFHIDLVDAVAVAVKDAKNKDEKLGHC
ncbi:sulfate transporter family-domain-containing protein [Dactylonectria macrodidyma]|uniref:Sulfate transporter family-domain-containing protein n=1 Tax=Dactylonectria macrodidyma TaxID=307937 RepID=A0A9P9EB53_9HYPO|nr:sulfate transporter family-domain-containing protein [Dactylonectria macrodidyma]